jgi:uncharacterized cupin superfamily protein
MGENLFELAERAAEDRLPAMPIDPTWIREGNPSACGRLHVQSGDRLLGAGIWECTPGTFDWRYVWDEFCFITAGEVDLIEADGTRRTMGAGDLVHFRLGSTVRWVVKETVRKAFFIRLPPR